MSWGQLQRGTLTTKLKITPATAQGDCEENNQGRGGMGFCFDARQQNNLYIYKKEKQGPHRGMLKTNLKRAPSTARPNWAEKNGLLGGGIDNQNPGLMKKKRVPAAPWYYHGKPQNHTRHCLIRLGGTKKRLGGGEIDNQYPGLLLEQKKTEPSCTRVLSRYTTKLHPLLLDQIGRNKTGCWGERSTTNTLDS